MAMILFDADDPLVLNGTYDREGYKPGERARLEQRRRLMAKRPKATKSRGKSNGALRRPETRRQLATAKRDRPMRPRQQPLIEDARIKPLEDIAASYADVRDQRIALNKEEVDLKAAALKLMHKYEKTIYRSAGVEIRIVPGEEDVKVRIRKPAEEEDVETTDRVELAADTSSDGDGDQAEA